MRNMHQESEESGSQENAKEPSTDTDRAKPPNSISFIELQAFSDEDS